ncbi:Ankyrin repeat and KH domain-containing protein mask [Taenia crassiceps]|uniref:Ankyrin repeat and KH domain-containing protein mask n=1 Tax=Taenia crassiceps TaxID=6207 RepID=A0ABR4PZ98_9CEST
MGTACHENKLASLGFSRAHKSVPGTTRGVVLYGGDTPISGQPDSRGGDRPYKENKTLPVENIQFPENRPTTDDVPAVRADKNGMALLKATYANDLQAVRQLLQKGANPNMFEVFGRKTALIVAAENNFHEVMHELLEHKASVSQTDSPLDVVNRRRFTPLMRAALKGHDETARQPLDSHATLGPQLNENKESALTLGCKSGKVEMVQLLLERGSPMADRSAELNAGLREAVLLNHAEVIKLLLNHGADVNHSDNTNPPVIFLAIASSTINTLNLLVAQGACVNQVDGQGYTPLMKAVTIGKADMVAALLIAGANARARRKGGTETALSLARRQKHNKITTMIRKALRKRSF